MGRTTKDQTRRKLRDAVVAEAVEHGIAAMSVAGVVKRAGVSAGTVYVHFNNKDEMLRSIYLEIKSEFHALMVAAGDQADSHRMIRQMWFDMFGFVTRNPAEFLFLEYGAAAKILTSEQQDITRKMGADIARLLQRGVDDGTLAPLPTEILSLLLVAPAMQLARNAVLNNVPIEQHIIELTFERVWRSIS